MAGSFRCRKPLQHSTTRTPSGVPSEADGSFLRAGQRTSFLPSPSKGAPAPRTLITGLRRLPRLGRTTTGGRHRASHGVGRRTVARHEKQPTHREEAARMTMTRKQLKAMRPSKLNRRKRNIRTNNMSVNPMRVQHASRTYQLYQI